VRLLTVALIISFFSSILFAEQVGNWDCKKIDIHCSQVGFPNEICKSNPDAWLTGFWIDQEVEGQRCPTECNLMNSIYDNCVVDKMKGLSKVGALSVLRSCERIACEPTFFQKLRYK
jgi:hypothetical protein